MSEQLNIFGEAVLLELIGKPKNGKFITMQQTFGLTEGQKCKDCKHLFYRQFARKYYKCALWRVSASISTDIRVNDTACGKFEGVN